MPQDNNNDPKLEVFRQAFRRRSDPVLRHAAEVAQRAAQHVEPFLYEGAGRRAPREVQKAIERFRHLPLAVRAQTQLWAWLLGDGTPPFKMRKEEVQYGPPPPALAGRQNCANCISSYVHVTTNTPICDKVRGVVAPAAWCNRWAPPIPAQQYATYQER